MGYVWQRFMHLSREQLWVQFEAALERKRRDYKRLPGNEAWALSCEVEDMRISLGKYPPTNEDR